MVLVIASQGLLRRFLVVVCLSRALPGPCLYPGCPAVTTDRYCPEHAKQINREKEARRLSDDRMYSQAWWRRLRKMVLDREPFCRQCRKEGRYTEATEVDHIIPVSRGGSNSFDNLQPLCKSCHSRKTAKENRFLPLYYS